MPAKGTKYATIEVDLQQWVLDEIAREKCTQAAIARDLGINRARVYEIVNGKANTMNHLEIIVEKKMKGDYMSMAKYAKTDAGLKVLKRLNFEKKLTPYERDLFERTIEASQKKIKKDPESFKKVLEILES